MHPPFHVDRAAATLAHRREAKDVWGAKPAPKKKNPSIKLSDDDGGVMPSSLLDGGYGGDNAAALPSAGAEAEAEAARAKTAEGLLQRQRPLAATGVAQQPRAPTTRGGNRQS